MAKAKTHRDLTAEELSDLKAFADAHGPKWKDKLSMTYWYNARIWDNRYSLHRLRNEFGPTWLSTFKLSEV